jgi:hypothetical protein
LKGKKERFLKEDEIVTLNLDDHTHVVSENHFFKTEGYYALVKNEVNGIESFPRSCDAIDAYVVPICLEKAKLFGIPVCDWEISYVFVSAPCIIYGVNYFSTPDEFSLVESAESAKEVIKHTTNNGRYPFCYQKLEEGEVPARVIAVFGRVASSDPDLASLADMVYKSFGIPLISIVYVMKDGKPRLSSLGPVKYSKLTKEERKLLGKYLQNRWADYSEGG